MGRCGTTTDATADKLNNANNQHCYIYRSNGTEFDLPLSVLKRTDNQIVTVASPRRGRSVS
jgi:hypothetical protein